MKPRMMLYGDFTPFQLASSFMRGFQTLGAEVIPLDNREIESRLSHWLRSRLIHRATIHSLAARRWGSAQANRWLLAKIKSDKPDLIFVLKGYFWMPETIRQVTDLGIPVFLFNPDNPFPGSPNYRPETLPAARTVAKYFIWSRYLQGKLQKQGVQDAVYLPFAWDPEVTPSGSLARELDYDLVFIGGWDREREAWLNPLAEKYDLAIWGPEYWRTRTRSRRVQACWQGRTALGLEFATISRRAKISLNILRRQNLPDGTNMRSFELAGCGAFSLSQRTAGAAEIFPEGEAAAYFSEPAELLAAVEEHLPAEACRRKMAAKAHEIVQGHTYVDRARTILHQFGAGLERTAA